MEVWLSPALGFDYVSGTARIYGPGTNPISWVSFQDAAEMCARGLRHTSAERRMIEFGGPEALSPLEVVSLLSQFDAATDPMQKSFAALMLGYLRGDAMNMASVVDTFGIKLTSVNDYARRVLASAATA
ncbi:MAG: hypothetical protein ACRD8O_06145 [Bryobacteraceae bacterium]